MADEYCDLVLAAYTGEVIGEAVFGGIAMLLVDPERRTKLEVLRLLEAQTEAVLRPLAERLRRHRRASREFASEWLELRAHGC
jgi:hypothetical protein